MSCRPRVWPFADKSHLSSCWSFDKLAMILEAVLVGKGKRRGEGQVRGLKKALYWALQLGDESCMKALRSAGAKESLRRLMRACLYSCCAWN